MARFAVNIKETLSHTIIVDNVDSYEEAEAKVKNAYDKCDIILTADNSSVDVEYNNDTEAYLEIFPLEQFNILEVYEFKE